MLKSIIFIVKSFLGNSYRHLAIFIWSHCAIDDDQWQKNSLSVKGNKKLNLEDERENETFDRKTENFCCQSSFWTQRSKQSFCLKSFTRRNFFAFCMTYVFLPTHLLKCHPHNILFIHYLSFYMYSNSAVIITLRSPLSLGSHSGLHSVLEMLFEADWH